MFQGYIKRVFLLLLPAVAVIDAAGQKTRLNLYSAYVLEGSYISVDNDNYYNGKIDGGMQWGGGVEYSVHPQCHVELTYLAQHTVNSMHSQNFDLGLNYILVGCNYYSKGPHQGLQAYAGLAAGVLFADIENLRNGRHALANKFSWSSKLGCNIRTGRVGIRLQSQLLSSVFSMKKDVYGGARSLGGFASLIQLGIGGGVTYQLEK